MRFPKATLLLVTTLLTADVVHATTLLDVFVDALVAAHQQKAASTTGPANVGAPAAVAKGVALTRDKGYFLVNKDVGSERWAITWPNGGLQMFGNVLTPSGAAFLDCDITDLSGPDPYTDYFTLNCWGGSGVVAPSSWELIARGVILPGTFFLP